jgi:hypothetical protein
MKVILTYRLRFIVCFLFVLTRTSNFSAIWRLSPLPVTDANLDLCLALAAFNNEGSFKCHTYYDIGLPF